MRRFFIARPPEKAFTPSAHFVDHKKSPEGLFYCAVEGTRTLDLPRDRRAL